LLRVHVLFFPAWPGNIPATGSPVDLWENIGAIAITIERINSEEKEGSNWEAVFITCQYPWSRRILVFKKGDKTRVMARYG
jgi:hypothetical protein